MDILIFYRICVLFWVSILASTGVVADGADDSLSCDFEQLRFVTDFDTGRLNGCEQTDTRSYRLHLKPENTPINPSPWYAFRIEPKDTLTSSQQLRLTLVSHQGPARYQPKVSTDKRTWAALPFSQNDNRMSSRVNLQPGQALYVAGQEIIDDTVYKDWLASLPQGETQKRFTLGRSREGRALRAYQHRAAEGNPWLIIIGRQHPPEVTGAIALLHFSNALISDSTDVLVQLRSQFNILIVPNMNPDGVVRGNWRHTSNGIDLNRDWRQRTQPESQQLHNFLKAREAAGEEIYMALDFHSTHNNIFYTMPADYQPQNGTPLANPQLVNTWLTQLGEVIPWQVKIKPGQNPNSGVFKQYIADNFAVHGVTYEVGDNSDRSEIKDTAERAVRTLAQSLLDNRK